MLPLACGLAAVADAVPKTDVVVLNNGDRITCEVKGLQRGLLTVATDNLGTVQIKWDRVASVETMRVFEAETVSGTRYYGALAPADAGQVAVVGATGQVRLDLISVVRLAPIEQGFWRRLDGSLSAGGSYTKSSGVGQVSTNSQFQAKRPVFEWRVDLESTTTVRESEPTSGRYTGQLTYTRLLKNRWVVPGFGQVESNPDLGYELRSTGGLGVGRNLIQTNRTLFQAAGGMSANREVPTGGESVTNIEALATMSYAFFTYDYPKTEVTLNTSAFSSLSDTGRVRVKITGSVARALLTNDFYTSISLFDDYDNRPPTAGAKSNDIGVTFSVGWKLIAVAAPSGAESAIPPACGVSVRGNANW